MKLRLSYEYFLLSATLIVIAFPFLVVQFVPSIDLPQHLAQIRLFLETLSGRHRDVLAIQWLSPNTLVYLLVGAMWALFPPVLSGKMTMLALSLLWSGSNFVLARAFGRPRESALLLSVLTFGATFYWGFINFLSGWPFFVLWLILVRQRGADNLPPRTLILIALCALALLFSHALWFVAGIGALAFFDTIDRVPLRFAARHAMAVAPVLLFALLWYPRFSASREVFEFDTVARWGTLPWERLTPTWFTAGALGGLRGPWDGAVLAAMFLWAALAIVTRLGSLRTLWDSKLGGLGLLILLVSLFAPDKYLNTIAFASRWSPIAIVLLLLALPSPRLPQVLVVSFPLAVIIAYSLATASLWRDFQQEELSGLSESLQEIPENCRTLGLDFIKESKYVRGRPFLQTFAYAQVVRGGELNFSFVSHGAGIVVAAAPPVYKWTPNLEWFPEKVDVRDFRQFDAALVNGTEEMHRALQTFGVVVPITTTGRWRAYLCVHPSPVRDRPDPRR